MRVKKYLEYLKEEIINLPSWPSLSDDSKNGYTLPMLLWTEDVFDESFKDGDYDTPKPTSKIKFVKSWNLENGLIGSYFEFTDVERGIIFTHLKEINLEYCDSKPDGYKLPKDLLERSEILYNRYGLGSPVFSTVVKKFEDGVKVVTTGSNWHLLSKLGIKKLGTIAYKGFVKELNIPLYSDDTQTPESKEAIWKKLLLDKSCEIVGWSQSDKSEIEIEVINGIPYYKGGLPIYFGDKYINKQILDYVGDDEIKYQKIKSLTKNLKLKSIK